MESQELDLITAESLLSVYHNPVENIQLDTFTPDTVVRLTRIASNEYENNEKKRTVLLAVLGRLHWIARNDPRVIQEAGYKTLKEYENKVLGEASRASLYIISGGVEYFPWMTIPEQLQIGPSKLREAIKAVKGKGMSEGQRRDVLDMVKDADNVHHAKQRLDGGTGEHIESEFLLKGKRVDVDELESWLSDTDMQQFLESSDPVTMVNRAFMEASSGMKREV